MTKSTECLACGLSSGRVPLPGGLIHDTGHWRVEHCVGPLGVGTLVVKPKRHVEQVADLTDGEVAELGPLLRSTADVVRTVTDASQVYVCLWSHGPVHVHFVVQPEVEELRVRFGAHGPLLQAAMFEADEPPDLAQVEALATHARVLFADRI